MERYLRYVILIITLIIFVTGCAKSSVNDTSMSSEPKMAGTQEDSSLVVYLANQSHNELLPYEIDMPLSDKSDKAIEVIDLLSTDMKEKGFYATIPSEIDISSMIIEGENVILYLNDAVNSLNSVDFILLRSSIIKSLTEIEGISSVEFYVDGIPMKNGSGKVYGSFSNNDVLIDSMNTQDEEMMLMLTLYYPDQSGEYLVKVYREVNLSGSESIEERIIKELRDVPSGIGLSEIIPKEAVLKSIEVSEGICYIDFDEAFKYNNLIGSTNETMIVYAIVNSLTELTKISHVQFLLEGEKVDSLKGHLNFSQPFENDLSLINSSIEYLD